VLSRAPVQILLVDRTNHHLFQPLLYQVATAALTPAEIASPIRQILRNARNVRVVLGELTGVEPVGKTVTVRTAAGRGAVERMAYDYLVLATGMENFYFGRDSWRGHAPGLKTLQDATALRARILRAFEEAETEPDTDRQRDLLTFVVVGGGPTGCEMAGAIAEMARVTLPREFRRIDSRTARIVLIEAAPRLLAAFSEPLAGRARVALETMGVEVWLGQPIQDVTEDGVVVGGVRLSTRTVVWAAGVRATPVAAWLGVAPDRQGRVHVGPDCRVPEHPDVFVLGDAMNFVQDGRPLPGVAQVALQQGRYAGRWIARRARGQTPPPPFRYRDKGNMAAIGRDFAVVESGPFRFAGRLAFWAWAVVHIFFIVHLHNRLLVFYRWMWTYITRQRMSRLILDRPESASPPSSGAPAR
jgi:NADH dehydrogenase FAD-containing subunit